jgi:hypothetical protein
MIGPLPNFHLIVPKPEKESRLQVWIVVTDSPRHFFKSETKRTGKSPPLSDHRALFKIGSPDIDVRTLRFLQNAICTICERREYLIGCLSVTITKYESSAEP